MSHSIQQWLGFATVSVFLLAADWAQAQQSSMHETSVELAQLPTFCWGYLNVPNAKGYEFTWHDCGPGANHYCGSLLSIMRAKREANKSRRAVHLGAAETDLRYTETAIRDFPKCSIRDHVASTRVELDSLYSVYGVQRPKPR
jgi:hypothetical protein